MTDALVTDLEIVVLCDLLEGPGANLKAHKRSVLDQLLAKGLIEPALQKELPARFQLTDKVSIGVGSGPQIGIQKGPPRFAFRTISVRPVGGGRGCGDG